MAARGSGNVLQESQFAPQNQLWADELRKRAMGQGGPSAAEKQMQAGLDTQSRQALSLARSQRGVSPGMALRQAQQAQGQAGAQMNQQAGIMRAQEQQAAGQAYQQAIGQGMSQEMAMNQARLAQQQIQDAWSQFGLASGDAWRQFGLQSGDQWAQFGMQGQQAQNRYNQLAQLQMEAMQQGNQQHAAEIALEMEKLKAQMEMAGNQQSNAMWGGLLGTAGQVGTAIALAP
jgi:hypothetical protein